MTSLADVQMAERESQGPLPDFLIASIPRTHSHLKQSTSNVAAHTKTAAAAVTPQSAYIDFLARLHRAWPDAPQLSVSFRDMSVVFPRPMHIQGDLSTGARSGGAPVQPQRSVPNLFTTVKHWAGIPVRAAQDRLGLGEAPLAAINEATGHIAPGSMTLVLAPPGGGKSTLLKALSGRISPSSVRGSLLFNGMTAAELETQGVRLSRLAAYVGQLDLHFPTLTVRETINFAAASSVPNAKMLPGLAADPELEALEDRRGEMLLSMLGLSESADVIVGSEMLRGISGGQRKRVTLAEMIVGNARLLALDEVSTGLDAAVTTAIFTALREMCAVSGCSVVTALLQPTPDTYAQFDQIILLHEGRVMYHGARSDVKRWLWQVCGVDVPLDVDEASFLVDFLANPTLAIESARIVAQTQSFMESTRAQRAAQAEAEGKGEEHKETPLPTSPDHHPELYDSYPTYVGAGASRETSKVRFHLDGVVEEVAVEGQQPEQETGSTKLALPATGDNSAEVTQAAATDRDGNTRIAGKRSSGSEEAGHMDHLAVPSQASGKAKRLGGGVRAPVHSTIGATPVDDMVEVHARYLASKWHNEMVYQHTAHQTNTTRLDPSGWSAYTRASFANPTAHSYSEHLSLCFGRQWLLFKRNVSVLVPRMSKAILIGLFYGLLFFRLSNGDYLEKLAVCMYGPLFAAMTNLSELPVASEARNVVAKQLVAGWFPPSAYYSAVCAMHIPLTVLESLCYGTLIYWISNLEADAGRYFFYLLVCFVASNAMATFYRFISYITPNPDVAKQLDLPFVVLFIVLNGFIIAYSKVPAWLRHWAYWIAPLQWGTKALTLNEFTGDSYSGPAPNDPSQTLGDYYLRTFDFPTDRIWKWMGVVYLVGWFCVWSLVCVFFLGRLSVIAPLGSEREHYEEAKEEEAEEKKGQAAGDNTAHLNELVTRPLPTKDDVLVNIDAPAIASKKNAAFQLSALPFVPVTLAWQDLTYSVPLADKSVRTLLSHVAGFAQPNTMTALMGASGAGKTTLMDCIAGRKTTGTLEADIRVNGVKADIHSAEFQRMCGYVEQSDLHIGTSTVEEALLFSARLRLPTSVSLESQAKFVSEVMELLGLTPFRRSIVGDAAIAGLAPAQLKLVTIGVELVANPSVLFLDEPTSGLDAPAAWRVMTAIKRIALTGRTVLCTIHQPAARLFYLFDRLLLLQPGGRTIYFDAIGSRGETLVSYFEAAVHFRHTLPKGVNPADWMLDVASDPKSGCDDWSKQWAGSKANQAVQPTLQRSLQPSAASSALAAEAVPEEYASGWVRYRAVQHRLFLSYWRNGPMNLTRAAVVIVIGLLLGLLYYKVRPTDYAGLNSFLAGIFMSLGFGPSLPASAALPTFFRQRAVMYRESTVRMYSLAAYSLSLTLCEVVAMSILMMLYIIPLYFLMDLVDNPHQFWRFYFILFLMSQVYASLSQLYLALLPNQISASVVHSIVFSFLFVFGGLLVTISAMPIGWQWFYHLISTPKAYVAVALGQLSCSDSEALEGGFGCGTVVTPDSPQPVQVYEYVSSIMENSSDSYGNQVGWLLLIIAVLKIATALGFRFISHLKR